MFSIEQAFAEPSLRKIGIELRPQVAIFLIAKQTGNNDGSISLDDLQYVFCVRCAGDFSDSGGIHGIVSRNKGLEGVAEEYAPGVRNRKS
jgi:hypothetical protein